MQLITTLRRSLVVLAATLGLGIASVAGASAADAATCSGADCNNRDPATSGCDASAITVDSQNTSKGRFDLRYSKECKTNWVRVPNYAGGVNGIDELELTVWKPSGGSVRFGASPTPGRHYGNMMYSPGNDCGMGGAHWGPNGSDWNVKLSSSGC